MSFLWSNWARKTILAAVAIQVLTVVPQAQTTETATATSVLKTLRPEHPRLILLAEDVRRIKGYVASDAVARQYYQNIQRAGERILSEPPVERVLLGPRLLDKSRRVVDRMLVLGLLFRLDGDKKWFERARQELLAVAAFSDWNPSHFLDVAEMTHGFAIGYDWFYSEWTKEERALIKGAIVEKGLRPAEKAHKGNAFWTRVDHNWNNVCNGGISSGALAVADEEPELAGWLLAEAIQKLPKALASYAPDGAWAEGPGYWGYATRYTVVAFATLKSALGTDFGLSEMKGLDEAGLFRIYGAGPTGLFFNFADAGERAGDEPSLYWLARRYQRPAYAAAARLYAAGNRGSALDLLYYTPDGTPDDLSRLSLDRHFHGADIVFLRSSWTNRDAIYVGFKAGDNKANHSHLDLGCFVMDALGERWAMDLGGDNYNLPAYFGKQRWTYYRLKTEGQNTLLLDDKNQEPKAAASILRFEKKADGGFAVADLTAGYAPVGAKRIHRGVSLIDRRRQVLVQDEIETDQPVEVVWAMHTRAEIKTEGANATLRLNGKNLSARILSPEKAFFESREVALAPPQNSTAGLRKLLVRLPDKTDRTRLSILLTPEGEPHAENAPEIKPLAQWQ